MSRARSRGEQPSKKQPKPAAKKLVEQSNDAKRANANGRLI